MVSFDRCLTGPVRTIQCGNVTFRIIWLRFVNFFFYSSAISLDLHSFPTRRSSDLSRAGRRTAALNRRLRGMGHKSPTRSEEHTSELQSLRHLVCRLLVEKKKQAGSVTFRII